MIRLAQRCACLLAALVVSLSAAQGHAQAPILEEPDFTPSLTFDVISIRLSPPPDANFHVSVSSPPHSSRFEAINLPVKTLLQIAYGFNVPIVGAPDWVANTFYVIQARSDEATDARLTKLTDNEVRLEKRHAIRMLLADRFALKTHLETRTASIYNLVVSKGGVKMVPVPAPAPPADGAAPAPRAPADVQTHASGRGLEFVASHASMTAVAGLLSSMAEAPVVDKTGLTGTYNYTLQLGREWSAKDPDSFPSLFTALPEQLGLKLESVREPLPNLVIDNMTKPTAN